MNFRCLSVLLLLGVASALPAEPITLKEHLAKVLQRPEYQTARWGILVVDAQSGKTVFEQNADQLFAPASVTKLYSCGAALVEFGADHRFETAVYQRGVLQDGRLEGDLILVASGDPTLGGRTLRDGTMAFTNDDHIYSTPIKTTTSLTETDPLAGLKEMAAQIKAAGVKQITGDVLIDTRLFQPARGSGSGPDQLVPIVVNDNLVDVVVTPAEKAGLPAKWEMKPATPFIQLDVQVETVAKGERTSIRTTRVAPGRFTVRGQIAAGIQPQIRVCVVDDPVGFARALFLQCLREQGIDLSASPLRAPTKELPEQGSYSKLPKIALFRSPPLSELLKVTLKVSHNLQASLLPLLLAVRHNRTTLEEGMRQQGRILAKLGVPLANISLESGAGGGNGDRVSPRATVKLIQALRQRPDWAQFEVGLPILGVDGTLHDVVGKDSPAKGKVRGKTGTYTDRNLLRGTVHLRSKSLAGVLTTAKGRELIYCIFVNDVPLGPGVGPTRESKAIGQLCELLVLHASD